MPRDWRDHQNRMLAAAVANNWTGPGVETAAILGSRQEPDVDPLQAAMMQHLSERMRDREERAAKNEEARRQWERAVQMQEYQNSLEDRREEQRFARGEPARQLELERGREELKAFRTTPRESETGSELARKAEERAEGRRKIESQERFADQIIGSAAGEGLVDVEPLLGQAMETRGLKPPPAGRPGGQARMGKQQRQALAAQFEAAGDLESAAAIRQAQSLTDVQSIPAIRAKRDSLVDPLLLRAAKKLDEGQPGPIDRFFGGASEPWKESSAPSDRDYWVHDPVKALQRAKALQAAFPEFRAHGITPEEIVAKYIGTGRFSGQGED